MTPLKKIVEDSDTAAGRTFDIVIQLLIVLSLVTFSLDTLPNLTPVEHAVLHWLEIGTVLVFTVEYLLRLFVATSKWRFAFSFFGIVDFLAIAPFYLAMGFDLRAVRAIRMLRLVRILKLARYSEAVRRFHRAFSLAREEIVLFFFMAAILLYLAAVGIYYFEHEAQPDKFSSVFHSLWWAVETLATVGYGDIYPVTVGGKCFTLFVLLIGLGIVSVPAGLVAAALSKARELE